MTVYNAQDLTPEFVISLFLYGQTTPPADIVYKSLRPLGACYFDDRGTGYLSRVACILATVALQ